MELTAIDWGICSVAVFCAVVGLFRGFSGQLGSFAGMVAGLCAGYFLFSPVKGFVVECNWASGAVAQNALSGMLVFLSMLVVFGFVRRVVAKFVSFLVPQPMNAIAGALVGLMKSAVVVVILAWIGMIQTGSFSGGFFSDRSVLVKETGKLADACMQGAAKQDFQ